MAQAAIFRVSGLPHRDALWLIPCTICLWSVGLILALDDSGRVFRGDANAGSWAAMGMAAGVAGIWSWRRWLIREHTLLPEHDRADDFLWLVGALGAIMIYVAIVPSRRLLPPNAVLCLFSGLAGARLLYSGWTRRVGNTLHCSRCNYEITDTSMPRRCPECAGVWAHRLVRGRVERNMNLVGVGVILLFLASLSPFPRLEVSRSFIRRQLSTNWLIAQAMESMKEGSAFDPSLWTELGKRKFTEQQIQPLADRVMQSLSTRTIPDTRAEFWLEQLVFDGRAPRAIADAFMERYLSMQLQMPRTGFTGRGVPIAVEPLELRRLPRDRVAIYLEAITQDSDPTPLAQSTKWEFLSEATLHPARQQPNNPQPPAPSVGSTTTTSEAIGQLATLYPSQLGTITVRAKVWVALLPPGGSLTQAPSTVASLYADPTAKSPAIWLRRFDLQAEMHVLDRGSANRRKGSGSQATSPAPSAPPPQ